MSDDPKYKEGSTVNINGVDLPNSVLCANCGYPLGEHMPHRNQGCPTKEIVARNAKRELILRCIMNLIIHQSISLN